MGAFIFSLGENTSNPHHNMINGPISEILLAVAALAGIPWIALVVVEPIEELSDEYYIYTGILCAAAFIVGMIVLGSFSGIVLNAATTLFICFVADRDAQTHGSAYGGGGGGQEVVLAQHVQVRESYHLLHSASL